MKKRSGMTFVEMIVVMVILSLFTMIAVNVFKMTFDAYQFNRKVAAQLYAQSNVDNVFSTIEKELLYAGSMSEVINGLPQFKGSDYFKISGPSTSVSINSIYALAEKVIITKKYIDYYDSDTNIYVYESDTNNATDNKNKTYFALFEAEFPKAESGNYKWSIEFDDVENTNSATIINITHANQASVTFKNGNTATAVQITASDTSNIGIEPIDLATYISPFLYEKALEPGIPIELSDNNGSETLWHGEMIYNSTLTLVASDIILQKYIPTIASSYTIILMDNVESFEATETSEIFTATLTYLIPDIKDASPVTVSRKFLKP